MHSHEHEDIGISIASNATNSLKAASSNKNKHYRTPFAEEARLKLERLFSAIHLGPRRPGRRVSDDQKRVFMQIVQVFREYGQDTVEVMQRVGVSNAFIRKVSDQISLDLAEEEQHALSILQKRIAECAKSKTPEELFPNEMKRAIVAALRLVRKAGKSPSDFLHKHRLSVNVYKWDTDYAHIVTRDLAPDVFQPQENQEQSGIEHTPANGRLDNNHSSDVSLPLSGGDQSAAVPDDFEWQQESLASISRSGPTHVDLLEEEALQKEQEGESGLQDDLQFYLDRAAQTKLLSRKEEIALARDIIERRSAWRRTVLAENYAQRAALSIYASAENAGIREAMHKLDCYNERDPEIIRDDLARIVPQLKVLIDQDLHVANGKIEDLLQKKKKDTHISLPHGESVIAIMEDRKISDENMLGIMKHLEELLSLLEPHKEYWDNPGKSPDLTEMIRKHGVWPPALQQVLTNARSAFASWKEARDRMALANTRLVIWVANRHKDCGLSLGDLISEGNLGLMRAVDRYDPELGYKFSTFATWWVRQSIQRGVNEQAKTIRIPISEEAALRKIRSFSQQYIRENGGKRPSIEAVTEALNVSPDAVIQLLRASRNAASLQAALGTGDASLGDFVSDQNAPSPLAGVYAHEVRGAIAEALRSLGPAERQVINLRFGLGLKELPPTNEKPWVQFICDEESYGVPLTLQEVGERLGITRERVRQIEGKASAKLRDSNHPLCKNLAAYQDADIKPQQPRPHSRSNDDPRLCMGMVEIGLPAQIISYLAQQGIYTVGDYLTWIAEDRKNIPYITHKTLSRVNEAIAAIGLMSI